MRDTADTDGNDDTRPRTASLVTPQKPCQSTAHEILVAAQPQTPYDTPLRTFEVAAMPGEKTPSLTKTEQRGHDIGPIRTPCPETGRIVHLRVFRDLSALAVRETGDTSERPYEILPANLHIESAIALAAAPQDRGPKTGRIVSQDGLLRIMTKPSHAVIDPDPVRRRLSDSLDGITRRILGQKPVCDPRMHASAPEGARYASFCVWPSDVDRTEIDRLYALVRQATIARALATGRAYDLVRLRRTLPASATLKPKATKGMPPAFEAVGMRNGMCSSDTDFARAMTDLIFDPASGFSETLLHGPDDGTTIVSTEANPETLSAHEIMAARRLPQATHLPAGIRPFCKQR